MKKYKIKLKASYEVSFSNESKVKNYFIDGDWKKFFYDFTNLEDLANFIGYNFMQYGEHIEGFSDFKYNEKIDSYESKDKNYGIIIVSEVDDLEIEYWKKKMNKEFIQWLANYADGFSNRKVPDKSSNFAINVPKEHTFLEYKYGHFDTEIWYNLYYPLLLQKAIEGINKEEGYLVFQDFSEIGIEHSYNLDINEYFNFKDCGSIEKAKEEALKFIWEKIK